MTVQVSLMALAKRFADRDIILYSEDRFDDLFLAAEGGGARRVFLCLRHDRIIAEPVIKIAVLEAGGGEAGEICTIPLVPLSDRRALDSAHQLALNTRDLFGLIHFHHAGIAVGLHAWETLLRTDNANFEMPVPDQVIDRLAQEIEAQSQLIDRLDQVIDILTPAFYFGGHDCYVSATIKNVFIKKAVPSLTLYKYMYSPVYQGTNLQYSLTNGVMHSRRYNASLANAQQGKWGQLADEAREKLDRVTKDYKQLSYIRSDLGAGSSDSKLYEDLTGLPKLQKLDDKGHFLGGPNSQPIQAEDLIFIIALHSFADEATVYGIDHFIHLNEYFERLAEAIAGAGPNVRIAIRFHPNTFSGQGVYQKDRVLQKALFLKLLNQYTDVIVSPCEARLGALADDHKIAIVTRWGTIGLECLHLNIPVICSPLAPYAGCVGERQLVASVDELPAVVAANIEILKGEEPVLYRLDGLYKLAAATFFKENGEPRSAAYLYSDEGQAYIRRNATDTVKEASIALQQLHLKNGETADDSRLMKSLLGW